MNHINGPYLFKVGSSTYAICGVGMLRAYSYVKEVLGAKPEQYKYLGPDTRTPKQQWESFTIGVDASRFTPINSVFPDVRTLRSEEKCPHCNGTGYHKKEN